MHYVAPNNGLGTHRCTYTARDARPSECDSTLLELTIDMFLLGPRQVVVGRLAHDLVGRGSCHLVPEGGGFVDHVSGHRFDSSDVRLACDSLVEVGGLGRRRRNEESWWTR
jgi:hypothetical protein